MVAFNEQVLLGRVRAGELKPGCTILLESMWREHRDPKIVASYVETVTTSCVAAGFKRVRDPARARVPRARRRCARAARTCSCSGMLCSIYSLDLQLAREQIALTFGKKDAKVIATQRQAARRRLRLGRGESRLQVPHPGGRGRPSRRSCVNGNTALALGVLASGMEICAMYPITPATSASHYLSERVREGRRHRAPGRGRDRRLRLRDRRLVRRQVRGHRSPPGPATRSSRKRIGLAVMAEIPLVVVNVQRGGPSTGQPTKVEQGDLLTAIFGSHGDAPKVVMAPGTHRGLLLFDDHRAQDRRDVQHGRGRAVRREPRHVAAAVPAAAVQRRLAGAADRPERRCPTGAKPYDWDPITGIARRFIPGQPGGMHTLTGLAHDRCSKVAYDPDDQRSRACARAASSSPRCRRR